MTPPPDLDRQALELIQGVRQWLTAAPAKAPLRGLADALADAQAKAAETVAERYRSRTDAVREALVARRDALAEPGADGTERPEVARELDRRISVLDRAGGPPPTPVLPEKQPRKESSPSGDLLGQLRKKASARPTAPTTPERGSGEAAPPASGEPPPVREIPGVGATYESRLADAGVTDAEAVAATPPDRLADVLQVSPKRAERIAQRARSVQRRKNPD